MSDLEDILSKTLKLSDDQKFWMIMGSLKSLSNSFELIATGINSGLSLIADQLKHNDLTTEYYLILDRILNLKEKYPDLKFETKVDIESSRFTLTEQMKVTLAWLFSKSPELKDEFNSDVLIGECPANEWLRFMLRNATLYRDYYKGHYNEYVTISYRKKNIISIIHNSWFKESPSEKGYVKFDDKLFNSFVSRMFDLYGKHNMANYCAIAEGTQYITSWLAERYCETMILALKNAYSNAVISLINQ